MPTQTYRLLAFSIPIKVMVLAVFAWCACQPAAMQTVQQADRIVVVKSTHTMTLYVKGTVLRTYRVSLGRARGRKLRQGDHRTPEGRYVVNSRNPQSAYHLALHLSFPNADDRARALAAHVPTGSDIMIHGLPNGFSYLGTVHRMTDWTDGCIAVTDQEMEEIFRLVPNNTPIDIQP